MSENDNMPMRNFPHRARATGRTAIETARRKAGGIGGRRLGGHLAPNCGKPACAHVVAGALTGTLTGRIRGTIRGEIA